LKEIDMQAERVIEVNHFSKIYGATIAVDDITFSVERGEIFGLLGPNGAGKTSTLESLEGLRQPDTGSLRIMGVDPARSPQSLRNLIGVQLQSSGLPANMTPKEAIHFFCAYHKVAPRLDLLDRLGLAEKKNTQFQALSIGQQRRLALALAMAHNPPAIFLDEPTAGLDVPARNELHNMMRELQNEGATILLATHDMAEAEKMTDRVAILLKGKIAALGTPNQITSTGAGLTRVTILSENQCLVERGDLVLPGVTQRILKEEYILYYTNNPGQTVTALIAYLEQCQDKLVDLRVERPTLEERFLEITGSAVLPESIGG
jgi:ABC-2 type transport system ATP-binding protein